MEAKIPKTKKECFALLDEMLSDEGKRTIIKEDVIELHFGLGMWIRNNWLYPQSDQKHLRKILCPNGHKFCK